MEAANIPAKFPIAWASGAGTPYVRAIPQASQIGITPGAASLTDGFPPATFVPTTQGGTPPSGQDANGILKQITQWLIYIAAGGGITYDATFQAEQGGYPQGALVQSGVTVGVVYCSTVDNNLTNPDSGTSAGWTTAIGGSTETMGVAKPFFGTALPAAHVFCTGQLLSVATYPKLSAVLGTTYGGDGVTTFGIPDLRGRTIYGVDDVGSAAGRITAGGSGTAATLGAALGSQLMPSHTHATSNDSHTHPLTQTPHGHTDAGHVHGASDSGHAHVLELNTDGGGGGGGGEITSDSGAATTPGTTDTGYANVTIAAGYASIEANNANVAVDPAASGVTINATGGGTAGNLAPGLAAFWIMAVA